MKCLIILPVLLTFASFLPSCTNQSSAAVPSVSGDGDGSLTYTVDGVKTVVKRPASTIYINEVSHNVAKGTLKIKVTIFPVGELFDFVVADKGTTNVEHYTPSFGEDKIKATYMSSQGHNYYGDHVSVVIAGVNGSHVSGTFSGTFVAEGKTVTVTDGSFDLPIRAKQ